MEKKFGALSSSVNPQELSKSVEGFIKIAGGLAVYFGYTAVSGDISSLADQIGTLVTLGYTFYGVAETAFGLIRKIVATIAQK